MSLELLDKTRKINKLLHSNNSHQVVFNDVCQVLGQVLESNVFVISKKGKILGCNKSESIRVLDEFTDNKVGVYINKKLNERLLSVLSTKENVNLSMLGFVDTDDIKAIITPIIMSDKRIGTLFVYKEKEEFNIEDIILSEYAGVVVGLDMLRSMNEEYEKELRDVNTVRSAIATLSFSELEAIYYIFEELSGNETILIASKIADKVGITRSVIVNALRKLESAGVIETKSSGMKGTYIKIINEFIFREVEDIKRQERG